MSPSRVVKAVTIGGWILVVLLWTASSFPQLAQNDKAKPAQTDKPTSTHPSLQKYNPDDYVGTETCQACHEEQFKNFSKTTHAKLEKAESWKGKAHGCESCHGPGKEHVELMSDDANIAAFRKDPAQMDAKIVALKKLSSKEASETCLGCHAGKEEHNNFRRGEHWRNDVGCIDCHFAHEPDPPPASPESHTLVADRARRRIDSSLLKMVRGNEVQLCLKCHTEMKSQFSMPFHHKVLEGIIKCSDCHNPHGGFETTQLRLTTGTDAACVKCHTDKQGPFAFEHSPVKVEGCTICHIPHGTSNPKLLTRSNVFQLCIECHTNAHQLVLREGEGAPTPPGFHDLRQERIRNCTTCHTAIHGSNTHNFFFRQ